LYKNIRQEVRNAGREVAFPGFKARRWVVRKKYLIYYEIDKTGKVIVLRVTDAQQDQEKLLT
jgi:plasmid stabilization system protein ParE